MFQARPNILDQSLSANTGIKLSVFSSNFQSNKTVNKCTVSVSLISGDQQRH